MYIRTSYKENTTIRHNQSPKQGDFFQNQTGAKLCGMALRILLNNRENYQINNNERNQMKRVAIVMAIAIALTGAIAVGQYRKQQINDYAKRNNCTWTYDYYINAEPICK